MPDRHPFRMAVDSPATGIRVIRTAGTLDRQAAAGLLRLVDAHIARVAAGITATTHLIIDLAEVRGIEPGGMETLHQHRSAGRVHHVGLHLTGGGGRLARLPLRVRQLLRDFSTFPTTEIAVAALTGGPDADSAAPAPPIVSVPAPRPGDTARSGLDRVHVIAQAGRAQPRPTSLR